MPFKNLHFRNMVLSNIYLKKIFYKNFLSNIFFVEFFKFNIFLNHRKVLVGSIVENFVGYIFRRIYMVKTIFCFEDLFSEYWVYIFFVYFYSNIFYRNFVHRKLFYEYFLSNSFLSLTLCHLNKIRFTGAWQFKTYKYWVTENLRIVFVLCQIVLFYLIIILSITIF